MAANLGFDAIADALRAFGHEGAEQVLDLWQAAIRATREAQRSVGIVNPPAIARHLLYLAQSLGDDAREGKAEGSKPSWTAMVPRYEEMRAASGVAALIPAIDKEDLSRFCGLRHLRQGSRESRFDAAMSLFVLFEAQRGMFAHAYFRQLVPAGEADLPLLIAEYLAHLLNDAAPQRGLDIPFPQVRHLSRRRDHPQVVMAFAYEPAEREKLERFHGRFATPRDEHLHLILYRPRRRYPAQLIRSFLALSQARTERAAGPGEFHNFRHVYRAPADVGHEERSGQGWALPLNKGLYLVGGQRPEAVAAAGGAARPPRVPFRSLDVLFFSWEALESTLPYGLMMTANKDGVPVITRVCALPTLLHHSNDAELGEIPLERLAEALTRDWDRERGLAAREASEQGAQTLRVFDQFEDMAVLAARIADLCNNDPRAWGVPPGYQTSGDPTEGLTHGKVEAALEQAFGIGEKARFASPKGPFNFWGDLRYPPLSAS